MINFHKLFQSVKNEGLSTSLSAVGMAMNCYFMLKITFSVYLLENWSPHIFAFGMQNVIAALENHLEAPQKVKHRVIIQASNSTPRYMFRKTKTYVHKKTYTSQMSIH